MTAAQRILLFSWLLAVAACGEEQRRTEPGGSTAEGESETDAGAEDAGREDSGAVDDTPKHRVTVAVSGNGRIDSDPPGIACPDTCVAEYETGVDLVLTPTADDGHRFDRWAGACAGQPTVVTMAIAGSGTCTGFFVPE